MTETHVVTCFLRHRGDVLLLRRSEAVGSYTGRWGGVAGHVADDAGRDRTPEAAARAEISEETGLADACSLVRRGDPFTVTDAELGREWLVHPFLFDCNSRDVTTNEETAAVEWVSPTAILRRETVPDLWTSYDRVRPTAESVAADRTHGSAYISVRALEVLRDEAGLATERGGDWAAIAETARELRAARPTMTALGNRVNRAMAAATDRTPRAVERAASAAIETALDADDAAAETAATIVGGDRLVTLSRSGTVERALALADPESVLVAESRPGGEGVGVAERLAPDHDVTLCPDAALAHELATDAYDAVLVGADTVLPDGRVLNKAGTRAVALAADHEGVPVYAVAAAAKVSPDPDPRFESADSADVYDGPADLSVHAPLFDVTPAPLLAGVITEDGLLDASDVAAVAEQHRARRDW